VRCSINDDCSVGQRNYHWTCRWKTYTKELYSENRSVVQARKLLLLQIQAQNLTKPKLHMLTKSLKPRGESNRESSGHIILYSSMHEQNSLELKPDHDFSKKTNQIKSDSQETRTTEEGAWARGRCCRPRRAAPVLDKIVRTQDPLRLGCATRPARDGQCGDTVREGDGRGDEAANAGCRVWEALQT